MKILNATHVDLDGVLCSLSIQKYYGIDNVEIKFCGYHNIDTIVKEGLESGEYDLVYITDISVSEECAKFIEDNYKDKVVLIDHHVNSVTKLLEKYSWVILKENDDEDGLKTSACKMVYDYFVNMEYANVNEDEELIFDNSVLKDVVLLGRDWDTWLWSTNGNTKARNLNVVCQKLGFDRLLSECHHQIHLCEEYYTSAEFEFNDAIGLIVELYDEELDRYVESCDKNLYIKDFNGVKLGIYYGELFASECANMLCKKHPELDAIMGISMKTGASIRSIGDKLHVGELAKEIGVPHNIKGGGHFNSAGVTLTPEFKETFIDNLLCIK